MPSSGKVEPLDSFEVDVRITAEDIAAQARARDRGPMPSDRYLAWCSWITRDSVIPCRDRHTEPFEL